MRDDGDHAVELEKREATDPTGVVRVVVVGPDRVAEVMIDRRWRSRIDPAELPNSILSTFHAARLGARETPYPRSPAGRAGSGGGATGKPPAPLGPGADREARWRRIREMWAASREDRARRDKWLSGPGSPASGLDLMESFPLPFTGVRWSPSPANLGSSHTPALTNLDRTPWHCCR